MRREQVKKLRKTLVVAVAAGVVASQVAPVAGPVLSAEAKASLADEIKQAKKDLAQLEKELAQLEKKEASADRIAKKKAEIKKAKQELKKQEAAAKAKAEKKAAKEKAAKKAAADKDQAAKADAKEASSDKEEKASDKEEKASDKEEKAAADLNQSGEADKDAAQAEDAKDAASAADAEKEAGDPAEGAEDADDAASLSDKAEEGQAEDGQSEEGQSDEGQTEDGQSEEGQSDEDQSEDGQTDDPAAEGETDQTEDPGQKEDSLTEDPAQADPDKDQQKDDQKASEKKDQKQKKSKKQKKDQDKEDKAAKEDADAAKEEAVPAPRGYLVDTPVIYRGFRFWTVAKDMAFAAQDLQILEEAKGSARVVGELDQNGLCYILKTENESWYYVESGDVRGFVPADALIQGEQGEKILAEYQDLADQFTEIYGNEFCAEGVARLAHETVAPADNKAFAYYRATVYQTVVEKDYALPAAGMVNIREEASQDGRVVGVLASNAIAYVIADKEEDWVYIESGDVRGFAKRSQLILQDDAGESILSKDEADYAKASSSVEPEENGALYYTITSIRSGVPDGMQRSSLLQYAAQFIGNPYVWGGTSLSNGADCSGFVQSVFAQYGYALPRTSGEQSQVGKQIAVEEAQPGDLIFYANGNRVYHVVIYAGDGQTIEAKSRKAGIVAGKVDYSKAAWAVRIMDEGKAMSYDIPHGLGSVHTYMGWQKVTNRRSQQYAFREAAGMGFDKEGFAVVDNRYVIACTSTFGNIGDYVDFYQDDGSVIPCVIGDFKSQNDSGCNVYGHMNGRCIVEFVVDQNSWYGNNHANPGTLSCHPEWNHSIVKVVNTGSFYD